MFRCHFTKSMRIVQGVNLTAQRLDEAIAEGQRLLGAKPDVDELYPAHARTRKSLGEMMRKLSVTSSQ